MPTLNQLDAELLEKLKQFCHRRMNSNACHTDDCENCPVDSTIHLIQEDESNE